MTSPVASQPRLLVSGSREVATLINQEANLFAHQALTVVRRMLEVPASLTPVLDHGGARGADAVFARAARNMGRRVWDIRAHPAQWSTHCFDAAAIPAHSVVGTCPASHRGKDTCRMAGHRRNAAMIALEPDLLLAWPMHPRGTSGTSPAERGSRGTWAQIEIARKAGVPTLMLWTGGPTTPTEPRLLWPGSSVTTDRASGRFMDQQSWLDPLKANTGAQNRWVPLEEAYQLAVSKRT